MLPKVRPYHLATPLKGVDSRGTFCVVLVCLNHLLHLSFSSVCKKFSRESCHEDLGAADLGDPGKLQPCTAVHSKGIPQNSTLAGCWTKDTSAPPDEMPLGEQFEQFDAVTSLKSLKACKVPSALYKFCMHSLI